MSGGNRRAVAIGLLLVGTPVSAGAAESTPPFPKRVRRIAVHVTGSPTYDRPDRRFIFYDPPATQRLWKSRFGAHWIVWTDGTIWPRHPSPREAPSFVAPADGSTGTEWQERLSRQAEPVYANVYMRNSSLVGIEVAHSGRSTDPFPPPQIAALVWMLRTMFAASRGRLAAAAVFGHKDLDARPAFVDPGCTASGCKVFVDAQGRPFRWRVDPPESLFAALARSGLDIARPADADADLLRAERLAAGVVPATAVWTP